MADDTNVRRSQITSSDLTKRRESRTVYADILGQQLQMQMGLTNRIRYVGGSGGNSSSAFRAILTQGILNTTPNERDIFLDSVDNQLSPDIPLHILP
jgi:hypothetical protein